MAVTFYGLDFETAPGEVMTPRRSTEALVDAALAGIAGRPRARVADIGTGAGVIAVALAVHAPHADVWASDVSEGAVRLARTNAARHGVGERVHMVQGDLLEPVPGQLCLILANLPYLPDGLRRDPRYAEYREEPADAVFSAAGGLAHYLRLLETAEERLDPAGILILQFHTEVLQAGPSQLADLRRQLERRTVAA